MNAPTLEFRIDPRRWDDDPAYRERVTAFSDQHCPSGAFREFEVYADPDSPTGRVLVTRSFRGPDGEIWVPSRRILVPIDPNVDLP